jgi:hypothetical protein
MKIAHLVAMNIDEPDLVPLERFSKVEVLDFFVHAPKDDEQMEVGWVENHFSGNTSPPSSLKTLRFFVIFDYDSHWDN